MTKRTYRFVHYHHRISAAVLCLLLIAGVGIPVAQPYLRAQRYTLNKQAQGLLGEADKDLAKKLTFNDKDQVFQFNKEAKKPPVTEGNPLEKLKSQVGGGGGEDTQLYSVDVSKDLSKGIAYYDNQMELSFKLTPQFSTMQGEKKDGHLIYPLNGVKGQVAYTVGAGGMKENVVLYKNPGNDFKMSYKLDLPKSLEARLIEETGEIGIYSADPSLFGNITYGTSDDQAKVEAARNNSEKTYLTFKIPAPVVMGLGKTNQAAIAPVKSKFELNGNTLSVITTGLEKAEYPLSIDPSVSVDSSSDFQTGNIEDNNLSISSGDLKRGNLTGGTLGSFTPGNSFTNGRYLHATVAYNGYLYVIGGRGAPSYADVQKASINSDGSISTWSSAGTDFSTARYGLTAVAYNGYLYVMGGTTGSVSQNLVQYTPLDPSNGNIGSWSTANSFPTPRYSHSSVVYNGYIYVVGGLTGSSTSLGDVQYAPIKADGSLGSWASTTSFTPTRGWQNAVVYNGYMYILGGEITGLMSDVQYVPINSDGTIGTWAATTSLPANRSAHFSIAYNGYMYVVGGYPYTTNTLYAPINANGTLGSWSTNATLFTNARYSHTAVAYNNTIYVLGGYNSAYYNDVQYAPINPPGVTGDTYSVASNNFATPRQAHTSVAYNGYMYVIGGTNGTVQGGVQYAPINSDGNLGTWGATTGLAVARERPAAVAYNGYLYVTGGRKSVSDTTCRASGSATWCDDVQYALICTSSNSGSGGCTGTPGTLGTWNTASTRIPSARWAHSAIAYNGYLYIIAGSGGPVMNDVRYAPINSNGNLGAWNNISTTSYITTARYAQSAVVYAGYMYVFGGDDNSGGAYLSDAQYAKINPDGSLGSWTPTTSFTTGRAYHTSVAANGYVYLIGGATTSSRLSDVQYAPINSDGSLGTWVATANLPAVRDSHTSVYYNGYIYAIGGNSGGGYLATTVYVRVNNGGSGVLGSWTTNGTNMPATVYYHAAVAYNGYLYTVAGTAVRYAPFNNDGSVGSWTSGPTLLANRNNHSAIAYNGYLYVLGGSTSNTVYYAQINANGSLGGWNTTTPFGTARSAQTAVAYNGYMYVLGGDKGSAGTSCSGASSAYCSDVQYAPINSDGTIGTWLATTSFNTPRYGHASVVYNKYIYVIGGSSPTQNDVQYAPINSDGTIGTWLATTSFNTPRWYHSAVAANGYLYIMGGSTSFFNDVQYAPINTNGTIGNWIHTTNLGTARYGQAAVVYNGNIYVTGGLSSGGSLSTIQYAPLNAMPRKALYSKLIDLNTVSRVTNIGFTGNVPKGLANINYRVAGADGVFGSSQSAAGTYACGTSTGRYVQLLLTLDDSEIGTFRDILNTNNAKASSLTVDSVPAGTPPEKRLRHGAWFSDSVLQPFETNSNGCS